MTTRDFQPGDVVRVIGERVNGADIARTYTVVEQWPTFGTGLRSWRVRSKGGKHFVLHQMFNGEYEVNSIGGRTPVRQIRYADAVIDPLYRAAKLYHGEEDDNAPTQ